MKHTKKHIFCAVMILLIIAFDQTTKYFASLNLKGTAAVRFIPGLVQLRYAENAGMAFSMLSGARWIFIAVTVVACVLVGFYLFSNRCKSLWLYWSLGVILSGGIGNLIDRVRFGYVVDFIEPTFMNFAVFNIADCAVTCGAVSLIAYLVVDMIKDSKQSKENKNG